MSKSHIYENTQKGGEEYMSFASARKRAKLTQVEVARAIGVDQSSVCLWETGKTMPRAAILSKLAALYGCTVDELLSPCDSDPTTE